MPSSPKRPGLPVPDPNWELDLHGTPRPSRKAGPDSKDELLAHALLRSEPDPLDIIDDVGDFDRTTLPPPEAMSVHVARMMAQAELLEELENEGDRPTPIIESERLPAIYGTPTARPSEPRASEPIPGTRPSPGRLPQPSRDPRAPRPGLRPAIPREEPAPSSTPKPAAKPAAKAPLPRRSAPSDPPLIQIEIGELDEGWELGSSPPPPVIAADPAPRPAPPSARGFTPAPRAIPSPPREAAPPQRATAPVSTRGLTPPPRKLTPPPAAIAPERRLTPEPLSLTRVPSSSRPIDLSDLPAVFSLDGLEGTGDPASEAVISPTLAAIPPSSEPAISPPFAHLDPFELAAELRGSRTPSTETLAAIEARIAAGDYGRALVLAESALEEHPGDPIVTEHAESCREMLYRRYIERLGADDHVPRLAVQRSALTGLTLDHRAGFLLSCVDGGSTIEEIIDVSAMPRLEAVRLLYELVQEGVIEMVPPR